MRMTIIILYRENLQSNILSTFLTSNCLFFLHSIMSTINAKYIDNDIDVSLLVTGVDTVSVHLHSQCSGACSDVQETAEVQS